MRHAARLVVLLVVVLTLLGCGVRCQETATATETTEGADTSTTTSAETTTEDSTQQQAGDAGEKESMDLDSRSDSTAAGADTDPNGAANSGSPDSVVQAGPFIDLLGPSLLSLEMIDETTAQFQQHLTNDALQGKKVVGLYFSADWYVY